MTEPLCGLAPLQPDDVPGLVQSASRWCDEWTPDQLRSSLLAGHQGVLLTRHHQPLGYGVFRILPGVMEILNIAIFYHERSKGYGLFLMNGLEAFAGKSNCDVIWLEVRASNEPARALYRSAGFLESGRRRAYYHADDGTPDDAILMAKDIGPA